GATHPAIVGGGSNAVEHPAGRPRANRQVREHRMKRMSEPDTMRGVLRGVSDSAGGIVGRVHRVCERFGHRVQCQLITESRNSVCALHIVLRSRTLPSRAMPFGCVYLSSLKAGSVRMEPARGLEPRTC